MRTITLHGNERDIIHIRITLSNNPSTFCYDKVFTPFLARLHYMVVSDCAAHTD